MSRRLAALVLALLVPLLLWTPAAAQFRTFNGAGDKIVLGTPTALTNVSPITICAWMYPASAGENSLGRLYDKSDADTTNGGAVIALQVSGVGFAGYRNTASVGPTNGWVANTATFTCSTHAGGTVQWRVWIGTRSVVVAEASYGTTFTQSVPNDTAFAATIGNRKTTANRTFDGRLGHVSVWDQVLALTQMETLRLRPYAPRTSFSSGGTVINLKGYWPLWESAAATALDHSGNASHGTVTGTSVGGGAPFAF